MAFVPLRAQLRHHAPEGIVALDMDGEGRDRFAALERVHGPMPTTMRDITPNGEHAFLHLNGQDPGGDLHDFVTRRHLKGYVVGPHSWHPSGAAYGWNGVQEIADMPEAWVADARRMITVGRPRDPTAVAVGLRHANLRDFARSLVGTPGMRDPDILRAAVLTFNGKMPAPKTEAEVDQAIGAAIAKFGPDAQPIDVGEAGLRSAAGIVPTRVTWLWRGLVDALLPRVDAVLWVTDPQKYHDAVLHDLYLRRWMPMLGHQAIVLNKVDGLTVEDARRIENDLRERLTSEALPPVAVLGVSALGDLGALREWLGQAVSAKEVVSGRLRASARHAVESLAGSAGVGGPGPPVPLVPLDAKAEGVSVGSLAILGVLDPEGLRRQTIAATRETAGRVGSGPLARIRSLMDHGVDLAGRRADPDAYL